MILFQNTTVTLDLDSEAGIVFITYPDLYAIPMPEIKSHIQIIADLAVEHNIKKVLLDSSKNMQQATTEESREVATFLAAALRKTPVQRVARLQSPKFVLEATVRSNIERAVIGGLSFLFETFNNREDALEWLMNWDEIQMT